MANDKFEGTVKKAEGMVESGYGSAIGDSVVELKGKARKALGSVQDAYGTAHDYVEESYDSVQTKIKDKPVQSALVALGIGFILGRIMGL